MSTARDLVVWNVRVAILAAQLDAVPRQWAEIQRRDMERRKDEAFTCALVADAQARRAAGQPLVSAAAAGLAWSSALLSVAMFWRPGLAPWVTGEALAAAALLIWLHCTRPAKPE